jgi:hypothetical protein
LHYHLGLISMKQRASTFAYLVPYQSSASDLESNRKDYDILKEPPSQMAANGHSNQADRDSEQLFSELRTQLFVLGMFHSCAH